MKTNAPNAVLPLTVLAVASTLLPGCAVIGDIFKAGVGVGIFAVVVVIAIIGGIAAFVAKSRS